ncbi:hypothetical protein BUALT_Bualt19G0061000 [Buddleja alternifolia]|uniref:RRM domain-containing protein n=1 Tax=Buddleja alternifolia TaxID=168488 RepID=A0AAV6W9Y7_9LAMI|nr:hypothetical protein BUALT_Bualt19G0061000 [Buddleja alternifolia]
MSGRNSINSVFYAETYHPIQAGSIDGTDIHPHDNAVYRALLCSNAALYDPFGDPKAIGDPYCTLFVARLAHLTNEDTLRKAMEEYGRVKNVRLVRHIVTGASRGYGFVEFETEKEMRRAYKDAHHTFVDDSEIIVDYNRQHLMPGWIPRRLGGGLGGKKESGQLRFGGRERPFRAPLRQIPFDDLKRLGIPPPPEGRYMSRFQVPSPPRRRKRSKSETEDTGEHEKRSASSRRLEKSSSPDRSIGGSRSRYSENRKHKQGRDSYRHGKRQSSFDDSKSHPDREEVSYRRRHDRWSPENYIPWRRCMEIALSYKNKLGFVNCTVPRPPDEDSYLLQWEQVNNMTSGHIISKCFRLHGYPPNYKPKSKKTSGNYQRPPNPGHSSKAIQFLASNSSSSISALSHHATSDSPSQL